MRLTPAAEALPITCNTAGMAIPLPPYRLDSDESERIAKSIMNIIEATVMGGAPQVVVASVIGERKRTPRFTTATMTRSIATTDENKGGV